MTIPEQEAFQDYLRSIEDELLQAVTADYIWLAAQHAGEEPGGRFHWRREACRDECVRRRKPRIWRDAERSVAGPIPQVA